MSDVSSLANDLRAIEAINQRDVQFALANDAAMSQWTDDFVLLPAAGPIEWATYHYSVRPRTGGEPVRTAGKLMRILQRQSDGSWKMYRGITTVDPPTPWCAAPSVRTQ